MVAIQGALFQAGLFIMLGMFMLRLRKLNKGAFRLTHIVFEQELCKTRLR